MNVTVACALPAAAVPIVGAPGTVSGVTGFDAADAAPVPAEMVAVTVNVQAAPLVSPVIVIGLSVAVTVTAQRASDGVTIAEFGAIYLSLIATDTGYDRIDAGTVEVG